MNSVLTDINEKIETQLKSISGMVIITSKRSLVLPNNSVGCSNKPDKVDKVIDPQFGLKDLVVFDGDQINFKLNEREKLDALARDNAQLIFNQLFDRKKLERSGLQCTLLHIFKYNF